jgi:hypothetical protein
MFGVFCETNIEYTQVDTRLREKQSLLTLQKVERLVTTGLHTITTRH